MDLTELAQRVGWLDETHRRDREQLIQLQQRVEALGTDLLDQSRQNRELQARLSNTQAQLAKFGQLEDALAQFKEEVKLMLQKHVEEQQRAAQEAQGLRLRDQEAQAKALGEMRRQLQEIVRLKEDLALARAETDRLHGGVQAVRQDLGKMRREADSQSKTLSFLEEQRRQDSKRLADLIAEQTEVLKKLDAYEARLQVASDSLQRADERMSTLWRLRDDLKGEQTRALEKLLLAEQERERKHAQRNEDWEAWTERLDAFADQVRRFTEQFEEGRRMMAQLDTLGEDLRQQQAQVAELQRLAEERQNKQFEEFQAEQERRWKRETNRWDHQVGQQDKANEEFRLHMSEIEDHLKQTAEQVRALWDLQEAYMIHQGAEMQRWLTEFNERKSSRA